MPISKKRAIALFSALLPTTQLLILGSLVLITVLIMFGFTFMLERQLVIQRQSAIARSEYKAVHNAAQLDRELLRLYAIVEGGASEFDQHNFTLQRDLVESRIKIYENAYNGLRSSQEIQQRLGLYRTEWTNLQSQLDTWAAAPGNNQVRNELRTKLRALEVLVDQIIHDNQHVIEARIAEWIDASQTLANLLTVATIIFITLVLFTTYGIFQFLLERQRTEAILRTSERQYRAILDAIPDAVLRMKRDGTHTDFKPAKHFAAFTADFQPLGKKVTDFLPTAIAQIYLEMTERALATDEEQVFEYELPEPQAQTPSNFEARVIPSGSDEVQIIVRDITEEKQQKQRQAQAQKLESIGMLAGGIAHDFNNLLTSMLTQTSLAKRKLAQNLPAEQHLDKAILTTERAADLTRQLLAYAGKGHFQIVQLDLNQMLRENSGLFETALPNRAAFQLELAERLPPIEADRGQIQQVVMNLVINAAEALQASGGHVRIATNLRKITPTCNVNLYMGDYLRPGDYASLQVSDNGSGMDAKTLNRIFDPFFSTKQHGHGLGLSATLGIIRTHHGGIHVQSQPGVGTTFTILFPISAAPLQAPTQPTAAITPQPYKAKRVLVIDDEAAIREAVVDILEMSQLESIAAASGAVGIEAFRQYVDQIGVVLLDMKMPGLSGEETYAALRQIDPHVKVILSSGYHESEVAKNFTKQGLVTFLQKPYNFDVLLQEIHKVLLPQPAA
ncbi:MAG: response regulator [Caldilineaceae bacterium]